MSVRFDERAVCDRCGRFGAYLFEGERLCADCYEMRSSCCPEFGSEDLTASDVGQQTDAAPPQGGPAKPKHSERSRQT